MRLVISTWFQHIYHFILYTNNSNSKLNFYMRNLKYAHLTPIFQLQRSSKVTVLNFIKRFRDFYWMSFVLVSSMIISALQYNTTNIIFSIRTISYEHWCFVDICIKSKHHSIIIINPIYCLSNIKKNHIFTFW